jgi:7-cyano-7-deazaguanine synthase
MERAVALVSGGLKSAVMVAAQREHFELSLVHVQTGSRAGKAELVAFEQFCAARVVREPVVVGFTQFGAACSHPLFDSRAGSEGAPKNPGSQAYVPGLMPALLTVGLLHALRTGARRILVGASENADDADGQDSRCPDQTKEFYQIMNDLFATIVPGAAPMIHTPFIDLAYTDIVRLGHRYDVAMHTTWSCVRGREKPCGHCPSCRQRARAFVKAGFVDASPEVARRA